MPSLTLKKVPRDLCARLKKSAKRHRRSINQEAIVCLQQGLPRPEDPEAVLADLDAFRQTLPTLNLTDEDIEAAINWGRS